MHGGSRLPARHRRGGVSWPTAMAVLVILAVIGGGSYIMLARASPAPLSAS